MCDSFTSVKPSSSMCRRLSCVVPCETIFEKPIEQVNLEAFNSSDVASLKTKDPFLYYSIPAVKKAEVLQKELDLSSSDPLANFSRRQYRNPKQACDEKRVSLTVTRCSRVSFECHTDLLLQDLINDINDVDSDGEDAFDNFLICLENAASVHNLDIFYKV
ncbi:hypothetical protein HJC23_001940 [Cyclotella cryptica]|uniref:Uncharacterized protein n=1 Tax=Cyclotella cryptica TaxID=29204 RepID=A0ABD3PD32_9STRA